MAALAGITGVVSWLHAYAVVREVGNTGTVAYLVPFVPDLMIVTSSVTLLEAARTGMRRPWMAMLSLAVGAGVTVVLNVAAGWRQGPGSCLLNGLIPVAFVLTFETLIGLLRRPAGTTGGQREPDDEPAEPPSTDEALALLLATGSRRALAEALGVPKSRVDSWAARSAQVAEVAPLNGQAPVGR